MAHSARGLQLERFCTFIEERLPDMDFKLTEVAAAFGISDRYIRQVFELREETPSAFVRRRRTEMAARMLCDPRYDSLTILTIAFDCGFNNAAYFSRCFHQRYGTSPRAYRKCRPEAGARHTPSG